MTLVLFLFLAGNTAAALLAQQGPDLTGIWKLRSTRARYSEVWTIKQTARDIRIRMDIKDDQLGDRVLDFEVPLDGKEHKQTVIGTPASITAPWDGDTLVLEIKPDRISSYTPDVGSSSSAKGSESSRAQCSIRLHPPQSAWKCLTGNSGVRATSGTWDRGCCLRGRSRTPRFAEYPRLPVLSCSGYEEDEKSVVTLQDQ